MDSWRCGVDVCSLHCFETALDKSSGSCVMCRQRLTSWARRTKHKVATHPRVMFCADGVVVTKMSLFLLAVVVFVCVVWIRWTWCCGRPCKPHIQPRAQSARPKVRETMVFACVYVFVPSFVWRALLVEACPGSRCVAGVCGGSLSDSASRDQRCASRFACFGSEHGC